MISSVHNKMIPKKHYYVGDIAELAGFLNKGNRLIGPTVDLIIHMMEYGLIKDGRLINNSRYFYRD